jgi:hypothetical protein
MSAATRPREAVHTREQFDFMVNAPIDIAWPLFGADGERAWAADWHPTFVWPATAVDVVGMVFKVAQGKQTAVWVNTAFGRMANRIQYVYVLPDVLVSVITLGLKPTEESTHVQVTYERTALADAANNAVRKMAERDRISGPQWSRQIERLLHSDRTPSR